MNISITNKEKVGNPPEGFGYVFIDEVDNKLKIKKK
jgi:hypothetical protein